jgi:hypothetical protein
MCLEVAEGNSGLVVFPKQLLAPPRARREWSAFPFALVMRDVSALVGRVEQEGGVAVETDEGSEVEVKQKKKGGESPNVVDDGSRRRTLTPSIAATLNEKGPSFPHFSRRSLPAEPDKGSKGKVGGKMVVVKSGEDTPSSRRKSRRDDNKSAASVPAPSPAKAVGAAPAFGFAHTPRPPRALGVTMLLALLLLQMVGQGEAAAQCVCCGDATPGWHAHHPHQPHDHHPHHPRKRRAQARTLSQGEGSPHPLPLLSRL